jgi:hypothetical protein
LTRLTVSNGAVGPTGHPADASLVFRACRITSPPRGPARDRSGNQGPPTASGFGLIRGKLVYSATARHTSPVGPPHRTGEVQRVLVNCSRDATAVCPRHATWLSRITRTGEATHPHFVPPSSTGDAVRRPVAWCSVTARCRSRRVRAGATRSVWGSSGLEVNGFTRPCQVHICGASLPDGRRSASLRGN